MEKGTIELSGAINDAVCQLTVCEVALCDINQGISTDCEITAGNGASADYVYYGVLGSLRSIRESLERAVQGI